MGQGVKTGRKQRRMSNLLLDWRFQLKYTGMIVALSSIISAGLGFFLVRQMRENSRMLALESELEETEVAPRDVPRTPTESAVAEIWTAVLGLRRVGVNESFFELGGHSLLATQVLSRIKNTFRVELPLRRFFETPTVADLARAVEKSGGGQAAPALPSGLEERKVLRL